MQLFHIVIPVSFCQEYLLQRWMHIRPSPSDNALMRNFFIGLKDMTINKQKLRFVFQLIERQVHGFKRSFQNIDPVNFFIVNHAHSIVDCFLFDKDS